MFDYSRLKTFLANYKNGFIENGWWKDEKFKWEAVKHFQSNWDVNTPNFAEMLTRSLSKTQNLLASMNHFPEKMIKIFAAIAPEEVRSMYIDLYDESKDVVERIDTFKKRATVLLEMHGKGAKQHYQYENAISTYLWLRYPDKYYIFKFGEARKVAEELKSDYRFKKGAYADNIRNSIKLYDEICYEIALDKGLLDLFKSQLTDTCYPDPAFKTLTFDIGFYISRNKELRLHLIAPSSELLDEANKLAGTSAGENTEYTKTDFLKQVYMTENRYDALVSVLQNKKNIILQGAPGVGKTFAAKRLAYSLMEMKDENRIELVQFHQSYSYEDFMMGYKPVEGGFELKHGVFYRFCEKAANQPEKEFFFIIDEINRGNMSKIFGELLMLIERDYRETKVTLAYNGLSFSVPKNLYIIGMMNTADRSLAMIDYALRRRFSFFDMEPGFDSVGFSVYQNELNSETLNELISTIKDLNNAIEMDKSLGRGFRVGHSYFCEQKNCTEEGLLSIVTYDILPMLREYWFDDNKTLQTWESKLLGVFQ